MKNIFKRNPASFLTLICSAALLTASSTQAQSISVPNGSFELQSGVGFPFGVNINVDSWVKNPRPGYFPEEGQGGYTWDQMSGVFVDTNPYGNRDGTQAAFLTALPLNGFSQSLSAVYDIGSSYNFTLGVFGKGMSEGEFLTMGFYYLQDESLVPIANTTISYSPSTFPAGGPFNLVDYSVSTPTVEADDLWAGKNISLMIMVGNGSGAGYWDMDNVRLNAVPEPGTIALGVLGLGGLAAARLRRRK